MLATVEDATDSAGAASVDIAGTHRVAAVPSGGGREPAEPLPGGDDPPAPRGGKGVGGSRVRAG
ncbi:hypothetical protein GCM10022214_65010 [Actinomadura miaoliensis]|uniref:Uncharacterized protein n=1 Tax=Actinomadura miaoliensis TaxID=430685 RepID=A0ABP7WPP0_9ACTN